MAYSSIQPILIVDEEDAIIIDDESEDEIEILKHGKRLSSSSIFCRFICEL
jgi:hypothetical protein